MGKRQKVCKNTGYDAHFSMFPKYHLQFLIFYFEILDPTYLEYY